MLMVSYAHRADPKGIRFAQYAKDKLPPWAVDARYYFDLDSLEK